MATARTARLLASTPVGTHGRLLRLQLTGEGELGFVGGQYVIVDTGVERPDGKRHKRAYSIVSPDAEQRTFELAVYGLPGGPGSAALHALAEGAEVSFSGPWGGFLPDDSVPRRTLVVATDSGITAALGLMRGRAFTAQRTLTRVVWLSPSAEAFLLPQALAAEVVAAGGTFTHAAVAPPGSPERTLVAHTLALTAASAFQPERVFLAGDGAVVHPLKAALVEAGMDAGAVRLESFFNNPARKAAA